ncbi:MAG: GH92 family glycosyl hydrolase [Planctomycetota bacterium]|jgi:predicted alpha-1,2-mannosidase|nr:GH92 family glycosyl hydrolase [Planctomycetota bacterium]
MTSAWNDLKQAVDLVDPLIDCNEGRWIYFHSAHRPFGLVSLAPDTLPVGDWGAGYRRNHETIHGFSHMHEWQFGAVPVLPLGDDPRLDAPRAAVAQGWDRSTEEVRPGYHALTLANGVRAELTASCRVGLHRYTAPRSERLWLRMDVGAEIGPHEMAVVSVRQDGAGFDVEMLAAATRRRPKPAPVFARIDCDRVPDVVHEAMAPEGACLALGFDVAAGDQIGLKVALSFVDAAGARSNRDAEMPDWDFAAQVAAARADWQARLGRVRVQGGKPERHIKFYTDLFHAMCGRGTCSDAGGRYSDMTGAERSIRQIPLADDGTPRYRHFNSDALWNAQWSLNALWPLVCPDVVDEFCNCLLDMYRTGGLIPRGPSGGNYTFVMTTAQSTAFLVSAWQKGIRNWDADEAWAGMVKNHGPGGLMGKAGYEHDSADCGGIEQYMARGWIAENLGGAGYHNKGCSQTLEHGFQDWCLAQFALATGRDPEPYLSRSGGWRHCYNPVSGFMQPRNDDGSWIEPFDPGSDRGFVEGNSWLYTFWVPHDIPGLAGAMGGAAAFCAKLESAFEQAVPHRFIPAGERTHTECTVDYGNEPGSSMAHQFSWAGQPWTTQYWVRRVLEETYGGITEDTGYLGDEDQGELGSTSALMSMGLFQVRGGCDAGAVYELTAPALERIEIDLDQRYYPGGSVVIRTEGGDPTDPSNCYIQSATWNGATRTEWWLPHGDLAAGGELVLTLGTNPTPAWGTGLPA